MVRPEIQATVDAIAEVSTRSPSKFGRTSCWPEQTPPASRTHARAMLDTSCSHHPGQSTYIRKAGSAELENFADFTDSLAALTGHIERLLDEPPPPPVEAPANRSCSASV